MKIDLMVMVVLIIIISIIIIVVVVINRVSFEGLVAAGHGAGEAGAVGVGHAAI